MSRTERTPDELRRSTDVNDTAGTGTTMAAAPNPFALQPGRRASGLGIQLDRIRRFKWLALAIVLVGAIAAAAAVVTATPTYTGQAVLSAASLTRAPLEDAALTQGYVMFFNNGSYSTELADRAGVDGDVTFNAQTAGLSPVFYITATSTSRETAQAAATSVAQAFAAEINSRVVAQRDDTIAKMTANLREVYGTRDDPEALSAQTQLQEQIDTMNADATNQVTMLQSAAGITEEGTGSIQTAAILLLSGLLLGCVAAIGAAISSRRLDTDYDVAEKLGITPLDVIPSATDGKHAASREVRLQHVLNIIVRDRDRRPTTVAVASAGDDGSAGAIATAIAQQRAAQGVRTLLVDADLRRGHGGGPGLAQLLSTANIDGDFAELDDVIEVRSDRLELIGPGDHDGDPYALFDRARFADVLERLHERADFVVVAAPALSRAGEAQVIGDLSDGTLLVIDAGTRLEEAREAVRVLGQVNADLVGTVLVERK